MRGPTSSVATQKPTATDIDAVARFAQRRRVQLQATARESYDSVRRNAPAVPKPTVDFINRVRGTVEAPLRRIAYEKLSARSSESMRSGQMPPSPKGFKQEQRDAFDLHLGYANRARMEKNKLGGLGILDQVWNMVDGVSDAIDRRIVRTGEYVDERFFGYIFKTVADMTVQSAAAPHMPKRVREFVVPLVDSMTSHLSSQLLQSMVEDRSRARSSYREMRVHYWADFPRRFNWNWVRARILYALDPADGNLWTLLREGNLFLFVVYAMLLTPGTAVPMFILTWLLIERTDEYQLVKVCEYCTIQRPRVHRPRVHCGRGRVLRHWLQAWRRWVRYTPLPGQHLSVGAADVPTASHRLLAVPPPPRALPPLPLPRATDRGPSCALLRPLPSPRPPVKVHLALQRLPIHLDWTLPHHLHDGR